MSEPKTDAAPSQSQTAKLLVELGPLVVFFAVNWQFDIFAATAAFMAAMAVAMVYTYVTTKKIPPMLLVSGGIVGVMGGLTLYLQNETFIKLKPTIVYLLFATVLLTGLLTGRPLMKTLFGAAFPPLTEAGWRRLTINWTLFFAFLAVLNEAVWRNVSTDTWVAFKAWGVLPLTFAFALTQVPVMLKHQLDGEGKADKT